MDVQGFSEWLESRSTADRIKALSLIYVSMTIRSRQFFLPEMVGKEKRVIEVLHGINEVHHTIANCLVGYATGDQKHTFPPQVLSQQLAEIESQYGIEGFLSPTIDSVRGSARFREAR